MFLYNDIVAPKDTFKIESSERFDFSYQQAIISKELEIDLFMENMKFFNHIEDMQYTSNIKTYQYIFKEDNPMILQESMIEEFLGFIKNLFVKAIKYIWDTCKAIIRWIKSIFMTKKDAYEAVDNMKYEDLSKVTVTIQGYHYTILDDIPNMTLAEDFINTTMTKFKSKNEQINVELFNNQFRGYLLGMKGAELDTDEYIDRITEVFRNNESEFTRVTYNGEEIQRLRKFEKNKLVKKCEQLQKSYCDKLTSMRDKIDADIKSKQYKQIDDVTVTSKNLIAAKKFITVAINDIITITTGKMQAIKDFKKQNDKVMLEAKKQLARLDKAI